jgi:cbb3-type cytochrome oxidase subunit 3
MRDDFANADIGMTGLFIFLGLFVAILVWLFRPGASEKYEQYGEIPFKEGEKND